MTMFYAYPSQPPDLTETLEAAAEEVNQGDLLQIDTWKIPSTTGKVIIDTITRNIDQKPIFGCDLTYLNANVLFELGYAIGRMKRLWISLNDTVEDAARNYRRFETLLPVGYAPYSNRFALVNKLYEEKPWTDVGTPSVTLSFGGLPGGRQRNLLFLSQKWP